MLRISIFILCFLNSGIIQSQCDSTYFICRQGQIDSFQVRHGPCEQVTSISIGSGCNINNLDSLKGIRRIDFLAIEGRMGSLISSISGLDSLRYVGHLSYSLPQSFNDPFPSLDTVGRLVHTFLENSNDLFLYNEVKHVNEMVLSGNGTLEGMSNLKLPENFALTIADNNLGVRVAEILSGAPNRAGFFNVTRSEGVDLTGLEKYDSINQLVIENCSNIDLIPLLGIGKMNWLRIRGSTELDYANGWTNVARLRYLQLRGTNFESISEVLPNLSNVECAISLRDNVQLNTVEDLADFSLPDSSDLCDPLRGWYMEIRGNPRLDACSNKYVCGMIERYPDSTLVFRNGLMCSQDSLIHKGCLSVSVIDDKNSSRLHLKILPNPSASVIELGREVDAAWIYTSSGVCAQRISGRSSTIDISNLPSGSYLLRIICRNKIGTAQFVRL